MASKCFKIKQKITLMKKRDFHKLQSQFFITNLKKLLNTAEKARRTNHCRNKAHICSLYMAYCLQGQSTMVKNIA